MREEDARQEATTLERLRVFLCHSSEDKPRVRGLYRSLRNDGFEPWLDEAKLLPGQEWQGEIEKAVLDSHVVIVCLSRKSVSKAGYVQREIAFSLRVAEEQPEDKTFILPVRLEACEIPRRLRHKHCANLFEPGGYSRLTDALRACAKEWGLFVPEPRGESGTVYVPTSGSDTVESILRPPAIVAERPRPSTRPPRPSAEGSRGKKKTGSKILRPSVILPLSVAAVLVAAISVTIGLGLSKGQWEAAVDRPVDTSLVKTSLVESGTMHPAPVERSEPLAEKRPEQPPATPTPTPMPAEPQAEVRQEVDESGAPPVSREAAAPPAPKPASGLNSYRIDIFRTNNSRKQQGFAKDIRRQLEPSAGGVILRDQLFKPVSGCQVLYFNAGKGDARNEDAAANALEKHLNSAYPKAAFKARTVGTPTPNIITLVIGPGCER